MREFIIILLILTALSPLQARVKLVALPERGWSSLRFDNPDATLVQEERTLTLQKGQNQIDFSWKAVKIKPESIRLRLMEGQDEVKLLRVNYPPKEEALVWEINSKRAREVRVRISYLLANIDRLVTYTGFYVSIWELEQQIMDVLGAPYTFEPLPELPSHRKRKKRARQSKKSGRKQKASTAIRRLRLPDENIYRVRFRKEDSIEESFQTNPALLRSLLSLDNPQFKILRIDTAFLKEDGHYSLCDCLWNDED